MNNLHAYLESRFQEYYKAKVNIGNMNAEHRQIRMEQQNMTRKLNRTNVLFDRRNIPAIEALTPKPKQPSSNKPGKVDRMMLLKRWKAEKENKLKQEKAKKKPIFQIGGRANVGFPGLTDLAMLANKTNKVTKPRGEAAALPKDKYSKKSLAPKDLNLDLKPNEGKSRFIRVTRSQKLVAPVPLAPELPEEVGVQRKHKRRLVRQNAITRESENVLSCIEAQVSTLAIQEVNVNTPKKQSQRKSVRKSGATQDQFRVDDVESHDENAEVSGILHSPSDSDATLEDSVFISADETAKTPDTIKRRSVYVSPFVTTSRGKGSVKKENLERSVRGLPSFTKHTTPDKEINSAVQATGAAYFHTVLTNEITRLLATCDTWNQYKLSAGVPEDARDMIDVAVGQANLLVNKKFQQFRGLIISCENGGGEQPVTCEDLHGFWDMVYMQVASLNARFNRLTDMRSNNWKEIQAEVRPKVTQKRAPRKRTKSAPSSNLRAAMHAARMKSQQSKAETAEASTESVFSGGFFVVRSPHKKTPTGTPTNKRLLESVLSAETSKQQSSRVSSPGVTMMKASQTAKSIENIAAESVKDFALSTPGRSILKSTQNRKSYWNMSKAVLFQDGSNDEDAAEHREQNKSTSNFIVEDTTENVPKRKSKRCSVKK